MKENFLHFIWRYRQLKTNELFTTEKTSLKILDPGLLNEDAGPDFLHAKIQIGDTLWAGNVEIHLQSKHWFDHQHQEDPSYDSVILHVVWEEDQVVFRKNGSRIPCLELRHFLSPKLYQNYRKLSTAPKKIPCSGSLSQVPEIQKQLWLDRLAVERLALKSIYWEQVLEQQDYDWEQVFFQGLAYGLGLPVNKEAMEQVARQTPLRLLQKHRHHPLQVEALLLGQAGFLESTVFMDDYPKALQKEYQFLQHKYQLEPIDKQQWKFSRMRPANFPSIRLAQLARLLSQSGTLFGKALAVQDLSELYNMLDVKVVGYWSEHHLLDRPSVKRAPKKLGKASIQLLLINVIVPFIFLYGKRHNLPDYQEKALDWLVKIPPEKNKIIRFWQNEAWHIDNALQSQAQIQLYTNYCLSKRCLDCAIGLVLLKGNGPISPPEEDIFTKYELK